MDFHKLLYFFRRLTERLESGKIDCVILFDSLVGIFAMGSVVGGDGDCVLLGGTEIEATVSRKMSAVNS